MACRKSSVTLPTETGDPKSWLQQPYILGEEEGPLLLSLPLRRPGTTPMKHRHSCLSPASGDSRTVETGRLARGQQACLALNTILAFLTSCR